MGRPGAASLFLLGKDYHLGDLLWLTAVIADYRAKRGPTAVVVGCPNEPMNRILERSPVIDGVLYGSPKDVRVEAKASYAELVVHDLRPWPLARRMLRDFRHHLPWLYYRDLWFEPRGQWLATLLHLGQLSSYRPLLDLRPEDRDMAETLTRPYVLVAPHIGRYRLPLTARIWSRIKGWEWAFWSDLVAQLHVVGYDVFTLSAAGQQAVPGTGSLAGLPIGQVLGVIEGAEALVTGESGLWFIAAATRTPFVIVPWWLPRGVDWPGPMDVPHRLICRGEATTEAVLNGLTELGIGGVAIDPASAGVR